ncbi:hypothetical protein QL285_088037 [Trifolium repens]|nr:hypothetical protein QL285_088037 [Trifolium repens]
MKMMKKFNAIFIAIMVALFGVFELGLCTRQHHNNFVRMKIGAGEETPNDVSKIESLARFAVQQHNNNEEAAAQSGAREDKEGDDPKMMRRGVKRTGKMEHSRTGVDLNSSKR